MVRVQLHLPEEDDNWLESEAQRLGTTKSALVREALQAFRVHANVLDPNSPEMQLIGRDAADDGPTDVGERHDYYLARWKLAERSQLRAGSVFVDTSAWYALQFRAEPDADNAQAIWVWLLRTARLLVTTNHVVGETYTLIRSWHGFPAAWDFIELSRRAHTLRIEHLSTPIEERAYAILARYREHAFSFVDATSFATMQALGIR